MSDVDDLVTWLRTQLVDDEQVARESTPGPWHPDAAPDGRWYVDPGHDADDVGDVARRADAEHIARHDPARVLAEVDAKRRIMAIHHPKRFEGMGGLPQICDGCGYGGICDDPITEDINDCPILRLLALPYADRPGYRDEWKP